MTIEQQIITSAQAAVKELYGQEVPENLVQLQKTRSGFEGNLTLVVFPFLKISHKKPEDTAQDLGAYIKENCEAIADFNVVKGFLNLVIDKKAWLSLLNEMNQNEKFGEKPVTEASPLVMMSIRRLTPTSRSTSDTCATTCSDGRWRKSWRPTATRW